VAGSALLTWNFMFANSGSYFEAGSSNENLPFS
jgi:hypothetical protein